MKYVPVFIVLLLVISIPSVYAEQTLSQKMTSVTQSFESLIQYIMQTIQGQQTEINSLKLDIAYLKELNIPDYSKNPVILNFTATASIDSAGNPIVDIVMDYQGFGNPMALLIVRTFVDESEHLYTYGAPFTGIGIDRFTMQHGLNSFDTNRHGIINYKVVDGENINVLIAEGYSVTIP